MGPSPSVIAYHDASEHLEDVKRLVKLWLHRHLILYAERYHTTDGDYSDLFVDWREVDAFLRGELRLDAARQAELEQIGVVEGELRGVMNARGCAAQELGLSLPLEDVRAAFDVDDERLMDVLLVLLSVDLEPEFVRAFSHAWCDFTRTHIEVRFLVEMVARTSNERNRLLHFFLAQDHPLFARRALHLAQPAAGQELPLMQQRVVLHPRVTQFLHGIRRPPADTIGPHGMLLTEERALDSVLVCDALRKQVVESLRRMMGPQAASRTLLLHGPRGCGKRTLLHAAASAMGRPLLVVDARDLAFDAPATTARLEACRREAYLHDALLLLRGVERCVGDDGALSPALTAFLEAHDTPTLLTSNARTSGWGSALSGMQSLAMPTPDADTQRALWRQLLPADTWSHCAFDEGDLAARYTLTGGAIEQVASAIMREAGKGAKMPLGRALELIRARIEHRLGRLATPVQRGFCWEDLVVPERTRLGLEEIEQYVRHREQLTLAWGLGARAGYGLGVATLFHGPPGTGKSMAASILSASLGMEIFQIDLSLVVDKYVGETEKNLGRIFDEGQRSQAVLLFDEADSLFGSRTEVKSSHDRYANLEVNFLLQRIEHYDGVCILTTNLIEALDEAFKRRIRFKVEFPFPERAERERLWATMLSGSLPVAGDVAVAELAEDYELSGGHIRNVVFRAAARAAHEAKDIDRAMLHESARREYTELGKLVRTA